MRTLTRAELARLAQQQEVQAPAMHIAGSCQCGLAGARRRVASND